MSTPRENHKILLVEDFEFTRSVIRESLQEIGFRHIIEAVDGQDALRKLSENPDVEIIISDWNMPNMNGYDLLRHIRTVGRYSHIHFIMATAQGEWSQTSKALEGGADRFISKPFTTQDLEEVVSSVLPSAPAEPVMTRPDLRVAHIQITDHLALGMLDHMVKTNTVSPALFRLDCQCMPSWNPVRDALAAGEVDAALLLAPLAMDVFHSGIPVRMILLAHRSGSICVRNAKADIRTSLSDYFRSKTFLLPHTLSIQHMFADMFLREIGLKLGPAGNADTDVAFEVVPPVKMPELMKSIPEAAAFAVAEPIGSRAVRDGVATPLFNSGDLWEQHPCCVVVVRDEFLKSHPDAATEFVGLLMQAGQRIMARPHDAAQVAVSFLDPDGTQGLDIALLRDVLSHPAGITTNDLYPRKEDLEKIQRYMHDIMGIGKIIDLDRFIDTRFVDAALSAPEASNLSGDHPPGSRIAGLPERSDDITSGSNASGMTAAGSERIAADAEPRQTLADAASVIDRMSRNAKAEAAASSPAPSPTASPSMPSSPTSPSSEKPIALPPFHFNREDQQLRFRMISDLKLVERVLRETRKFAGEQGFTDFSGMDIIIRELINNAMEHGHRGDPDKIVRCVVRYMRDGLFSIMVEDQGPGFDYKRLEMTIPDDARQIRNRGYPFIKAFSEEIEFNDVGNRITVFHRIYVDTSYEVHEDDHPVLIRPSGDITAAGIEQFRSLLKDLTDRGHTGYRFDLSHVTDIDSLGLSAFIVLSRMVTEIRGQDPDRGDPVLEIINANAEIRNLFRMTHLDGTYHIFGEGP